MLYRFITKLKAQWVTFAYPYTIKRYMCTIRTTVLLMIIYENVCLLTNCLQGQYIVFSQGRLELHPSETNPAHPQTKQYAPIVNRIFVRPMNMTERHSTRYIFRLPCTILFNIIILYPFVQSMCKMCQVTCTMKGRYKLSSNTGVGWQKPRTMQKNIKS